MSTGQLANALLTRELESEVMDTEEEARDYDAMDHRAVNTRFCDDLFAAGNVGPSILDVGTGTALIPIELCSRSANVHVVGVDLAEHMLALGQKNLERAGLERRVSLEKIDAKKMPYQTGSFATTISNSIVHHIPEPRAVLAEMLRCTAPDGLVFIRDLARPSSIEEIDRLVALHAGETPDNPTKIAAFERQRALFRASLGAALTTAEVTKLAHAAGMIGCNVRMTSDRHWTLVFHKYTV